MPGGSPQDAPAEARAEEVMLAFAAVAVVMVDRYQPRFLFFPVQAFALAWIFFTAGHRSVVREGLRARLREVGDGARALLLPYCVWDLAAAVATWLLARAGVTV